MAAICDQRSPFEYGNPTMSERLCSLCPITADYGLGSAVSEQKVGGMAARRPIMSRPCSLAALLDEPVHRSPTKCRSKLQGAVELSAHFTVGRSRQASAIPTKAGDSLSPKHILSNIARQATKSDELSMRLAHWRDASYINC